MANYFALGELVGRVEETIYPLIEHIAELLGFNEKEATAAAATEGGELGPQTNGVNHRHNSAHRHSVSGLECGTKRNR